MVCSAFASAGRLIDERPGVRRPPAFRVHRFVAAGGLLALRWPRAAWIHLPAVAWGALVQFADWMCPLTYLEDALRGDMSEPGGFIARYLMPVVYPDLAQEGILTVQVRIALGCAVIAINVLIYGWVLRRRRKGRLEAT